MPNDSGATRERQVRRLFDAFGSGRGEGCSEVRALFSPSCVWACSGMPPTTGPEEAVALIESYEEAHGVHHTDMEIVHLVANGDVVLVEHVDRARRKDGFLLLTMSVAGVLEFEHDKLVAWREYFDPASVAVESAAAS